MAEFDCRLVQRIIAHIFVAIMAANLAIQRRNDQIRVQQQGQQQRIQAVQQQAHRQMQESSRLSNFSE